MIPLRKPADYAPILMPLIVVAIWALAAASTSSPLFPGPAKVAQAIWHNFSTIMVQLGATLTRVVIGFAVAAAITVPLGIMLGRLRIIGQLFEPVMDMLATLPPPAIVPLVMLFAGTGDAAKITMIAFAAAIPMLMNTYEASKTQNEMANLVARSLRLSRFETMLRVDLPAALPMIATGVRMAVAAALLVSVTSEILLATDGIGVFLQRQQENFQIAGGLAGIFFISLTGLVVNTLILAFEKRWLFWHYRAQEDAK
ncbi:ABC transporter permease [Paracoccus sp. PAR01]|uniref:ABC transporter permease n=1 Tax=Paracoccus sp. PAR01 TaxID=2769282 RepID=UPI00177FEC29|nr:ABC transporter permease [Paracoccus sp. PAR01]MBD9527527.1 ABC transporter permease [Paracoccus sp. PAR01]